MKSNDHIIKYLNSYSKKIHVNFNIVLTYYIFERFLYRVSCSKWKNSFILKGGFLLSLYMDINDRTTKDIDFCITHFKLDMKNLKKIITEIISEKIDEIKYNIISLEKIMINNEYQGVRVTLKYRFSNFSNMFHIDVATGDIITPFPSLIKYPSIIGDNSFEIYAYNLETILSEKIEFVLVKQEFNSRMKDYYDIFLISKFFNKKINTKIYIKSFNNTIKNRGLEGNPYGYFKVIKNSILLERKWNSYVMRNDNVKGVSYKDVVSVIEHYLDLCKFTSVYQ